MKKTIKLLTIAIIAVLALTGCKKYNKESLTIANSLAKQFEIEMKNEKDVKIVAETLSKNSVITTATGVEKKTPNDFLTGFDEKITNFKNAAVIQPMIGSIPFIAYVFETDNPQKLETELDSKKNMRWNICTEADESVIKIVDNYVLFVMSPKSFEE